ncbi:hypothetical protein [Thermoproteus tenax]|uniref:hypothetical protein n=1 Tax=Thermoproteus tenax TaxID=2271 RepID=UPI0014333AF7|nr:hypothetical protein [Thermoproteus tenax]
MIAGGVAAVVVVAPFLLSSAGPPFDSHNYEVNYTIKLTYTVLEQTTTVTGRLLVGEGPKGNSFHATAPRHWRCRVLLSRRRQPRIQRNAFRQPVYQGLRRLCVAVG